MAIVVSGESGLEWGKTPPPEHGWLFLPAVAAMGDGFALRANFAKSSVRDDAVEVDAIVE